MGIEIERKFLVVNDNWRRLAKIKSWSASPVDPRYARMTTPFLYEFIAISA